MNRRPLDTPHHDASRLTADERAELVELQSRLALDPNECTAVLARLNCLQARCTHPSWTATVQPTRPNNSRPAPAPVQVQDDRRGRGRDRQKASKRDRYDALDDDIHARHRPHFWGHG